MLGHQNRKRSKRNRYSKSNYYHLYIHSNQLSLPVVMLVLLVFAVARQIHTESKRNTDKDKYMEILHKEQCQQELFSELQVIHQVLQQYELTRSLQTL
jgi:hypothetical protein